MKNLDLDIDAIENLTLDLRLGRFLSWYVNGLKPQLTDLEAAALALIQEAEGHGIQLNPKQLAQKLHSSEESLSPKLKKLREAHLCEIIPYESLRRNKFYRLTEAGRTALRQWVRLKSGEVELVTLYKTKTAQERKNAIVSLTEQKNHLREQLARKIRNNNSDSEVVI